MTETHVIVRGGWSSGLMLTLAALSVAAAVAAVVWLAVPFAVVSLVGSDRVSQFVWPIRVLAGAGFLVTLYWLIFLVAV